MQLPTAEQRTFFEQAASQYQSDLAGDTSAQEYLTRRGFTKEVADTYRLGVVRHPLLGHERYAGRLAIPYLTPRGGVVTFAFRCIGLECQASLTGCQGHPKYLTLEAVERSLYNVLAFKADSLRILLVEGELDAITWSMCGYPTIGIPGAETFKDHHARCMTDYAEIFAVTDGDDAGYKLGTLLAREVRARVVRLPKGQDSNSIYMEGGRNALARVLNWP